MNADAIPVAVINPDAPADSLEAKQPYIDNGVERAGKEGYFSREYMQKEWDRLWTQSWLIAGVTSAILNAVVAEKLPGPGTVFLHVDWSFKAPVHPGDRITGAVEVTSVRDDKPITELKTTVTRDDGVVVLEGTAVCYTMAV